MTDNNRSIRVVDLTKVPFEDLEERVWALLREAPIEMIIQNPDTWFRKAPKWNPLEEYEPKTTWGITHKLFRRAKAAQAYMALTKRAPKQGKHFA